MKKVLELHETVRNYIFSFGGGGVQNPKNEKVLELHETVRNHIFPLGGGVFSCLHNGQ